MAFAARLPRNAQIWLPSLLKDYVRQYRRSHSERPQRPHVLFAIADHYEPLHGGVSQERADARVRHWREAYSTMAVGLTDVDGRPPQHSFFYPAEQYDGNHAEALGELVEKGFGEVEIHLHHHADNSANLRQTLLQFARVLSGRHGLLTRQRDGSPSYGFIHGDWALDNARPDGSFCGVNDEISILVDTGCYADFTLPAAPDISQTRTVNSIYYAIDDPARPKSHDHGIRARVGGQAPPHSLLMVQGPLCLDWRRRKAGIIPGVESGTLDASDGNSPHSYRFDLWRNASVAVEGRPEWIFVKVHTHGAPEPNAEVLLGPQMRTFHEAILRKSRELGFALHYVTTREMANIVRAAEDGHNGDPSKFRDYYLPPPERMRPAHQFTRSDTERVAAATMPVTLRRKQC